MASTSDHRRLKRQTASQASKGTADPRVSALIRCQQISCYSLIQMGAMSKSTPHGEPDSAV